MMIILLSQYYVEKVCIQLFIVKNMYTEIFFKCHMCDSVYFYIHVKKYKYLIYKTRVNI